MAVRVVKEDNGFDEEAEKVVHPPFKFASEPEAPQAAERSLPAAVHPQAAQVQAVAVLTALAAVITPKLVIILAVIAAALLTAYAETREQINALIAAGMFDGLTVVLAFANGGWRR